MPLSSRCSDLLPPFPHGTLHEQSGRAVWVASAECVRCPSLSLLPNVLDLQPFRHQAQAVLTLPARHPSRATLACRLGCFGGAARSWILFPPSGTSDSSVLRPGLQEGLARFFFFFFFRRRGVLRIFPGEYHLLFLFFDMIYAVTLSPHETTSSSTI